MIAAGTGAKVGIKLFVLGEGRWETQNFPATEIKTADLVWDWAAMASNFSTLEVDAITKSAGKAFITETSDDVSKGFLVDGLPPGTTTTEAGTMFSTITDQTELDTAFPSRSTVTLTRMFAELPQTALGTDLQLQASVGGKIPQTRMPTKSVNHSCPSYVEIDCPGITPTCDGTSTGTEKGPQVGLFGLLGPKSSSGGSSSGCAVASGGSPLTALGLAAAALALLGARRRRGPR
jgi:MYXO-CTERM domain-containing protein